MEKAVLRVDGMSCDHCVKTINKTVGELPGIKSVDVDLKGAVVSFVFDPARTPLKKIEAAITAVGFTSKGLIKKYQQS